VLEKLVSSCLNKPQPGRKIKVESSTRVYRGCGTAGVLNQVPGAVFDFACVFFVWWQNAAVEIQSVRRRVMPGQKCSTLTMISQDLLCLL
jgi:hypothetical protein